MYSIQTTYNRYVTHGHMKRFEEQASLNNAILFELAGRVIVCSTVTRFMCGSMQQLHLIIK